MTTNYHVAPTNASSNDISTITTPLGALDNQITINANQITTNTADLVTGRGAYASLDARFSAIVASGGNVSAIVQANTSTATVTVDDTTGWTTGTRVGYPLTTGALEYNTATVEVDGVTLTLGSVPSAQIDSGSVIFQISESEYQAANVDTFFGNGVNATLPNRVEALTGYTINASQYGLDSANSGAANVTALQAAIDAMEAVYASAYTTSGLDNTPLIGTIEISGSNAAYVFNDTVTISYPITLQGNGNPVLEMDTGADAALLKICPAASFDYAHVNIKDLYFLGSSDNADVTTNPNQHAIWIERVAVRLSHGAVTGAFTVGETVTGGTSSATGVIKSVESGYLMLEQTTALFTSGETITTAGGSAVLSADATTSFSSRPIAINIDNCGFARFGGNGIYIHGGSGINITRNRISYCFGAGIKMHTDPPWNDSIAFWTNVVNVHNNLIRNNRIGIIMRGYNDAYVSSEWEAGGVSSGSGAGFGYSYNTASDGFFRWLSMISIRDNVIESNRHPSNSTNQYGTYYRPAIGILMEGAWRCAVEHNHFEGQRQDIVANGKNFYNTIRDNKFVGHFQADEVAISSIEGDGATVTVVTGDTHYLSTGQAVTISGTTAYDTASTGAVTVVDSTSFTYADTPTGAEAAGAVGSLAQTGGLVFRRTQAAGDIQAKRWIVEENEFQVNDLNPVFSGTHTGADAAAGLTDAAGGFPTGGIGLDGMTVRNVTDDSSAEITANASTTITGTLSGGTRNNWNTGDVYAVLEHISIVEAAAVDTSTFRNNFNAVTDGNAGDARITPGPTRRADIVIQSLATVDTPSSLSSSWANVTGQQPVTYYKDSDGYVSISGQVDSGTPGAGSTIFTLPMGYRPHALQYFTTWSNGETVTKIGITSTGVVTIIAGSATNISLNGIKFYAGW